MDTNNRYIISIIVILAIIGYLIYKQKMNAKNDVSNQESAQYHIRHIFVSLGIILVLNYFVHQTDEISQVTQMPQNIDMNAVSVSQPIIDQSKNTQYNIISQQTTQQAQTSQKAQQTQKAQQSQKAQQAQQTQKAQQSQKAQQAQQTQPRAEGIMAETRASIIAETRAIIPAETRSTVTREPPIMNAIITTETDANIIPVSPLIREPSMMPEIPADRKVETLKSMTDPSSIISIGTSIKKGGKIISNNGKTEVGFTEDGTSLYMKNKNKNHKCCGPYCSIDLEDNNLLNCQAEIYDPGMKSMSYTYNEAATEIALTTKGFSVEADKGTSSGQPIQFYFIQRILSDYPDYFPLELYNKIQLYDIDGKFIKDIDKDNNLNFTYNRFFEYSYILVRDEGIFLFDSNDKVLAIF